MSLVQYCRSGRRGAIWLRFGLVCGVLLSLLGARNVPPSFSRFPGLYTGVSADSHHDQRPRFDHNVAQWTAPSESFLLVPPSSESCEVAAAPHSYVGLQEEGVHYNRPPPLS